MWLTAPVTGGQGRTSSWHPACSNLDILLGQRLMTHFTDHLQLERADPIADRVERGACINIRAAERRRHRLGPQQLDQRHSAVQNLIMKVLNRRRSHRLELSTSLEN